MAEVLINSRKAREARERAEKLGIKPGVGAIVGAKVPVVILDEEEWV